MKPAASRSCRLSSGTTGLTVLLQLGYYMSTLDNAEEVKPTMLGAAVTHQHLCTHTLMLIDMGGAQVVTCMCAFTSKL